MVVTGIFVVLSGVVLASNTRFGNTIILQNLAHDIALSVREAQIYGIAVRRCDPGVTSLCDELANDQFNLAYGMHFTSGGTTFELFADVDGNGQYDPGETVIATSITNGFTVTDLCRSTSVGTETCDLEELNIAFRRPEPDACIEGTFNNDDECVSSYGRARIVVEANRGGTAEVVVESTGQISVH